VHFGFFPESAAVDDRHGEPSGEREPIRETIEPPPARSFRERVEAKVDELRRTVTERLGGRSAPDEAAIEREIDDEIERLKKRLNLPSEPNER
jgi:hypothetical protein